jgi:urea transport system permease protein
MLSSKAARSSSWLAALFFVCWFAALSCSAQTPREIIAKAILTEDSEEQAKLITSLSETGSEEVRDLLNLWKEGGIYLAPGPEDTKIPVTLSGEKDADDQQLATRFADEKPLLDESGAPVRLVAADLDTAETDSSSRIAMKGVLDLIALSSPNLQARLTAVSQVGMQQNVDLLPALRLRQQREENPNVRRGLREAIALTQLLSEDPEEQIAAARELAALKSIPSQDALKTLERETQTAQPAVAAAATEALQRIATHVKWVNFYGTVFRGLSLGSILLVVALGLAITFGLMGVINMAHGELIVVGAYATYIVQNVFSTGLSLSLFNRINVSIPGMNTTGSTYEAYFLVALPVAFLSAAFVGLLLERGVIRFLYRRPLESLLATWGVSLVLQQLFRMIFGANNVQVYSPSWLSGNWTVGDVLLGWNRVFVICFAVVIVACTWLLLNKTSLGLLIRAVMQNRQMAACMGVRTERVNMLTFAFGSGLAGLAGAFLSQIGNVGPSLGQSYIVDSFMTVVVGGVGSLAGTVLSALSIGVVDQSLQQILLNPVLGKILVLVAIILFLQWRPAGLFVTKSRSLES